MPCVTFQIEPIGPTLQIGISSPRFLIATGAANPPIVWIKAVADTGCTHTSIHSSIARRCGLNIVGRSNAITPAGIAATNNYFGDIFINSMVSGITPYLWPFPDRGLVELLHQNPNFDALLGMDILRLGSFNLNGITKQGIFCW
jgi:hypothetical protein